MEIRTYRASIKMECCRDGDVIHSPAPLPFFGEVRKPHFEESFAEWKEKVRFDIDSKYRPKAEKECYLIGTADLCKFDIKLTFGKGQNVTGITYRTLRMAARGPGHTYGLSKAEFYKRMSKRREHYTKEQSRQLLQSFNDKLITTKSKV